MLFVRCDDRLIHGQVLFKWVDHEKITKIIIVDDKTSTDIIEKQMILMTKPKNCLVEILHSSQIDTIQERSEEKSMILFKNIHLACLFIEKNNIQQLNIGRMASGIGKTKLLNNLFLTKEEIKIVKNTIKTGVIVYSQMLPNDTATDLSEILETR